jgi:hypothetical protein
VWQATSFDKGVLAEILEPIMGKGLIPADLETWKIRRRAIVPGFHQKWLQVGGETSGPHSVDSDGHMHIHRVIGSCRER